MLRAIQQQGLAIPRDISLIACDRTDLARLYPGPITLIDRDIEEIGRTAAQLLLERLTEGSDRAGAAHLLPDPPDPRRLLRAGGGVGRTEPRTLSVYG